MVLKVGTQRVDETEDVYELSPRAKNIQKWIDTVGCVSAFTLAAIFGLCAYDCHTNWRFHMDAKNAPEICHTMLDIIDWSQYILKPLTQSVEWLR